MTEIKVLTLSDGNSLAAQFEAALANRPDWAQSFTTALNGSSVRVAYSANARFGLGLQEAMNYLQRHGYDDDALLDARDIAEEIKAACD